MTGRESGGTMNNYKYVDEQINEFLSSGLSKAEVIQKASPLCLGWPYVYGAAGQVDTVSIRKTYINAPNTPDGEKTQIKKNCDVLSCRSEDCTDCKYFPDAIGSRCFDCRGFTRWICDKVGITIKGGGATSQWNDKTNWSVKGDIKDMPSDQVCCVFMKSGSTMSHTGMHIGGGIIVHCSGELKYGKITDKGWTNYAVPVGIDDVAPTPAPTTKPTLRKGSTGPYVVECQEDLIQLGYSVGSKGADGIFGSATEKAVKAFQSEHTDQNGNKLKIDGIVGNSTWWALDNAIQPQPEPGVKLYTVHIPHQNEEQYEKLKILYPDAWKTEE